MFVTIVCQLVWLLAAAVPENRHSSTLGSRAHCHHRHRHRHPVADAISVNILGHADVNVRCLRLALPLRSEGLAPNAPGG